MSDAESQGDRTSGRKLDERFDQVCDEFESAWVAGSRPRMGHYLLQLPESQRADLFRELLGLEVDYRADLGESIDWDDYREQFPQWSHVVNDIRRQAGSTAAPMRTIQETASFTPDSSQGAASQRRAAEPPADKFGDYELLSEIARGGMGVVYKARQIKAERIVALKMILTGNLAAQEDIQRFYTEAKAAANLEHSAIVPIYEVGEHQGHHFFSMAYIEGRTLADLLDDGPLEGHEAAVLLSQIADAVAYAHEHGTIHRDLKPGNILIDREGKPHVTDFGLAKRTDTDSDLTGTGQILGTPSYMAPEQAAGRTEHIGCLSDVYSLGAVLYALVTGRPPFQTARVVDTLMQVMQDEPVPPRILNPKVPRELETICLKCLDKEPHRRYHSAGELAKDLGRWLNGEPLSARPPTLSYVLQKRLRKYRWAVAAVSCVFLACILAVGFYIHSIKAEQERTLAAQQEASAEAVRATRESARARTAEAEAKQALKKAEGESQRARKAEAVAQQERDNASRQFQAAQSSLYESFLSLAQFERDRNNVPMARTYLNRCPQARRDWRWNRVNRLVDQSIMKVESAHDRGITCLRFSPDGSIIATSSVDDTIKLWDGVTCREIATLQGHDNWVSSLAFSSDGKLLASGGWDKRVIIWDLETRRPVGGFDTSGGPIVSIVFGPDNKRLALGNHYGGAVLIVDVNEPKLIAKAAHGEHVYGIDWKGDQIASCGSAPVVKIWDATTGELRRELKGHSEGVKSVAFNPDATRLASVSADTLVKIWDTETGNELYSLNGHAVSASDVRFSPDGRLLASIGGDLTVRLWDAERAVQLMVLRGHNAVGSGEIDFSPDGRRLASCGKDRTLRLWDVDYYNPARTLAPSTRLEAARRILFSPDGKYMYVFRDHIEKWAATDQRMVSEPSVIVDVAMSPDGQRLVTVGMTYQGGPAISVWDAESLQLIKDIRQFEDGSTIPGQTTVACDSDSRFFWTLKKVDANNTVSRWDMESGKLVDQRQFETWIPMAFSADGGRCLFERDHDLHVWDWKQQAVVHSFSRYDSVVTALSFSAAGNRVAAGYQDGVVEIFDLRRNVRLSVAYGHDGPIAVLRFSPDGNTIATASGDNTVRLWRVETGHEIKTFRGYPGEPSEVAFHPNGHYIVTSGDGGTIDYWFHPDFINSSPDAILSVEDNALLITCHGTDPSVTLLDVPAVTEPVRLQLRVRSNSLGRGQLTWATKDEPRFRHATTLKIVHDDQWHDLEATIAPDSPLQAIRIEPSQAPGEIHIETVRLVAKEGKEVAAWSFL